MKIGFDIDGVLTPKNWNVNISLKIPQAEIKQKIHDAYISIEGFAVLDSFLNAFYVLEQCDKELKDEKAWNHIFFLTGRKKSEYYESTRRLFNDWMGYKEYTGKWTEYALERVIWYPEDGSYVKAHYFGWKWHELFGINDPVLYIDDDKGLVDLINEKLIPNIKAIHFEAKR